MNCILFLIDDYYLWKFGNLYSNKRRERFRTYYVDGRRLNNLQAVKDRMFSFDLSKTAEGLNITTQIFGFRVIRASGLVALLFPEHFATIDRFIIQPLMKVRNLLKHKTIALIDPAKPTINDGVLLINIMKKKTMELNQMFGQNHWLPRDLGMVLWAIRTDTEKRESIYKTTKPCTSKEQKEK